MLRMTFAEAADFLGYSTPWIYNTLPKIKVKAKVFLEIPELSELLEFSFLAKSYENYPYDKIANKKFTKLVSEGITVKELGEYITKPSDFYDTLIAIKLSKKDVSVFNIVAYVTRKLGLEDWRAAFKEYIFGRLAMLFISKKEEIYILMPGIGDKTSNLGTSIREEAIKGIREYFKSKLTS